MYVTYLNIFIQTFVKMNGNVYSIVFTITIISTFHTANAIFKSVG